MLRADSAYYGAEVIAAARRARGTFLGHRPSRIPLSLRRSRRSRRPHGRPSAIRTRSTTNNSCSGFPNAEVAEVPFTAFRSKAKAKQVAARLIVRRVRDANPDHLGLNAQGELFAVWRHHAVFTDSPLPLQQAEADHRKHAIIEQVIADLKNGPLAHLPSGKFAANSAWLVLAAIAFNLTRAAGALASVIHARATTGTIRTQLITIAARIARHGRGHITLHMPEGWHREAEWMNLFEAACGPPLPAAA